MESMTTTAPKTLKPEAPKTERKPTGDPLVDGIPVALLTFERSPGPDLPTSDSKGGMARLRATKDREITYLHKLRHHRVVELTRDPQRSTRTYYIPETWVTWTPVE